MERSLIQDAERIEEMTEGRIPFDRACWIALYIQRITSGMSHEDAIRLEEEEHAERGNTTPEEYDAFMEQPAPELPAPYLLMDDSDDSAHGTYETEAEAIGAAEYDRLHAWTIYRAGQIVTSLSATA